MRRAKGRIRTPLYTLLLAFLTAFLWWAIAHPRLRLAVHTIHADPRELTLAREVGADAVVQLFPWREIEPTQGQFIWQTVDEIVAGATYYGLDLIVRLDQPPDWALQRDVQPGEPPFDLQAWATFVHAVARRFRGRVHAYIIWNEPNLALEWADRPPDPAGYTALLAAGAQAVREADPGALVVSAGLAPTNTDNAQAMDDRRFLRQMLRSGAAAHFDVLGVHAYGFGHPPEAPPPAIHEPLTATDGLVFRRAETLRAIAEANNAGRKPVWITEMGWTVEAVSHSAWQQVTPDEQAAHLRAAFALARRWSWLKLMAVWNLGGEDNPEWRGYSLLDGTGVPRPAYDMLRQTAATLHPFWSDLDERFVGFIVRPRRRYQVLAADEIVHLGDAPMPLPWVPLYRARNPSPRWEGIVYVEEPGDGPWHLTLRLMQSNSWSNRVWVNGAPLAEAAPLDDFSKSWVAHTWAVPAGLLRPGANRIAFTVAHAVPLIQDIRFAYDEVQIKDVVLWR